MSEETHMTVPQDLAQRLSRHGQDHLLHGLSELDATVRHSFLARLAEIDWEELAHPAEPLPIEDVGSSRVLTLAERAAAAAALTERGNAALREGAIAVLMVAGGQGTRLGHPGPKGSFRLGVHSAKSIYQLQAEKVLALSHRAGRPVPFLVMTSPATDAETRAFFAANAGFGLVAGQLRIFSQGTVPSLDAQGRALLTAPGCLLENPDGHGGCFQALLRSGELMRLRAEGVRRIVYIQVDNVLAPVDDPVLVGLAERENADVVTKVLAKRDPDEKVGHLVRIADRDRIVEYTELSPEQTRLRGPDGELLFRWGSPAMHCWSVAFLGRLADRGFSLPLHRSRKPLKAWRDGGPVEVEGWKSERFIFDLVPEAAVSLGLELHRESEFAPVKNASGEDSAATAVAMLSAVYRRWLAERGVEVAPEAVLEISPLYAATAAQFAERWDGRLDAVTGDWYLET